jgi:hypothetical protein
MLMKITENLNVTLCLILIEVMGLDKFVGSQVDKCF